MFSKALLGLSLAGIVVLAILLFKAGLNYAGVCTVGINVTKWHRVTSGELLDYLTLKGGSKAGLRLFIQFRNSGRFQATITVTPAF